MNKFIWHELNTSDPDAAARFYGAVVGWQAEAYGGGLDYQIFSQGGYGSAGLIRLPEGAEAPTPHWACYIQVGDVDAEAEAVRAAGGSVRVVPTDIPNVGRFAAVADPQGATYMVMAPSPRDQTPASPPPYTPGQSGWHELHTTDTGAAVAFYRGRYGWEKVRDFDMGEQGAYSIFTIDGVDAGGMMNSHLNPQWLPYFIVTDIDAAKAAIDAGGGAIIHGPAEVPGGGFIIQGNDPQGAMFAVTGPRLGAERA